MNLAARMTRNPTLLTLLLSIATLAGYAAYRLTLGAGEAEVTDQTAADTGADDHDGHVHEDLADAMPDVTLDDLAGTPTPLSDFVGRPLLVNFWATWCVPCIREIPMLKTFHDEHPDIDVIGIAVDRLDDVLVYAEDMQFNYPVLIGQSSGYAAMGAFRNDAGVLPFSVYIAPDGAMLGKLAGELHLEDLENFAGTIDALAAGEVDLDGARHMISGHR